MSGDFARKYGPWALVAGASEGLGAEYGRQIAARGLNVLLVARRAAALESLAGEIRAAHRVEVRTVVLDLGSADLEARLRAVIEGLEIGLLVYNAAYSAIGDFVDAPLADALRTIDVNCRGPVVLAHVIGQQLAARGRGGIVIMSSMAAGQGSPLIATYAATKSFARVLAEGLWSELGPRGVDVLACCPGATRTPNYARSQPRGGEALVGEPGPAVQATLSALGRRMSVVPGLVNALSALFMGLLPRRRAVQIMGRATRSIYGR